MLYSSIWREQKIDSELPCVASLASACSLWKGLYFKYIQLSAQILTAWWSIKRCNMINQKWHTHLVFQWKMDTNLIIKTWQPRSYHLWTILYSMHGNIDMSICCLCCCDNHKEVSAPYSAVSNIFLCYRWGNNIIKPVVIYGTINCWKGLN